MFCLYCGTHLPDDALFCNKCGRKLEIISQQESAILSPLPPSLVSASASRFSELQDGVSASPSVSQPAQDEPTHDAATSPSSTGSFLQTDLGTAELSSLPPTTEASSPGLSTRSGQLSSQAARPKSHRRMWRVLSSLMVVLVLLATWGGFLYVNRSTPSKALTTVCTTLKDGDYPTAYGLFSKALQSRLGPESTWASGRQQDYKNRGGLTNYTVSSVSESGSSATGVVTLTFGNGRSEEDRVKLIDENGTWVIQETGIQTAIGTVSEFALPTTKNWSLGIAVGPDDNLWFTEYYGNKIGRISSSGSLTEFSGKISEFALPSTNSRPVGIVTGPDGNLWFTEYEGNKIGRISTNGSLTEFALPTTNSSPEDIALGPDGNLWFTESDGNKIGRISTNGSVSEFALPTVNSDPTWIVAGSDSNLWFTEYHGNKIGRISSSGDVSEFALSTAGSYPLGIVLGPDGNLWFTESSGNKIGRISTNGSFTEFALPSANSWPAGIVTGPDGNLWFIEGEGNKIGRISTNGSLTAEFTLPTADSKPWGIVLGPDGNLWFTESGGDKIGRIGST